MSRKVQSPSTQNIELQPPVKTETSKEARARIGNHFAIKNAPFGA